ncbi:serine hydrolase domain-containing protein [Flavobacterium paronense]|uniref:Serine hydrolase domain-containing protein n=1 Tax=Flavobacterium paronense TaxID=1392775 RepID=A0ABV5GDX7_9FLAO|nr:serine hydrolase domain-containing protein [Flavobacterium paronense]MDN3678143.1 serine hydrolase domain-containing protein [Flavobacterium paronense]
MKKLSILFVALIISSCSSSDSSENPSTTQTDIASVDSKVTAFMNLYNIPGASLAISKNGKLVYVKGYGKSNVETNENVTVNSRFRLASLSKTYTGIAIMKLIQDGQFTLESPVFGTGGILGNDYGTSPYNSNLLNIKVKHLLQHTSGSWGSATGGDVIDQNPSYTYQQLFDWILNTRPNPNVPGNTYDYTNVGYNLLGRIIEKKSGKTYINYIKEDILAPIGVTMTDIAGKTEAERKANEVKYYGQGNDASFVYTIAFPRRDADGGLMSTATDVLKLITAADGFTTRPDILNQASITAFTTPSSAYSGYANGIGIWSAENVWFNYGSLPGTRTAFMRHNNGMCVALLLNSRADPSANENPFVYAMQDLVLDFVKNSSYNWQNIDQF